MFDGCVSLTNLDLSTWDTSSVTSMTYMFFGCYRLTSLDVTRWDTSGVKNMDEMFYNCNRLITLDVTKWNTSNVTNMCEMFHGTEIPFYADKSSGKFILKVDQTLLTLKNNTPILIVGEAFNARANIKEVKDHDGQEVAQPFVNITGTITTNKVGIYPLIYTYTDPLTGKIVTVKATVMVKPKGALPHTHTTKLSSSNKPETMTQSVINYQIVYRLYNKNTGEHFYTMSVFEKDSLVKGGSNNEEIGWSTPNKGKAVYRVYNPNAKETIITQPVNTKLKGWLK